MGPPGSEMRKATSCRVAVNGLGFKGLEFRVKGLEFGVMGLGLRV